MALSYPGPGHHYDLIVVGAGIAGSEAAYRCARAGLDVLLISTSLDTVYNLLGDGVRLEPPEGTLMAELHQTLADEQSFVSNWAFHREAKERLEHTKGIHLLQSSVSSLWITDSLTGVTTWEGVNRLSTTVALCTGSFLRARLRIGSLEEIAGRLSEMAYDDLFEDLLEYGFGFQEVVLEAHFDDDSLPYSVNCQCFDSAEIEEFYALKRVPGLYSAGVSARGYMPFEQSALEGKQLAEVLIAKLS
jgi:tRNA U34 5-carboxymethylaminomethyl modifying enzyme MnmG/GidA